MFTFFPPSVLVTAVSMNYSCVVYGGVVIIVLVYYVVIGHRHYISPFARLRLEAEDEL